jgi:hypothetical protein
MTSYRSWTFEKVSMTYFNIKHFGTLIAYSRISEREAQKIIQAMNAFEDMKGTLEYCQAHLSMKQGAGKNSELDNRLLELVNQTLKDCSK